MGITEYLQNLSLSVPLSADVIGNYLRRYRAYLWTTEFKHTRNFWMKKSTYIHSFICSFRVRKSWKAGRPFPDFQLSASQVSHTVTFEEKVLQSMCYSSVKKLSNQYPLEVKDVSTQGARLKEVFCCFLFRFGCVNHSRSWFV